MYPEFTLPPEQMKAWLADRQGAIVGRDLADAVRLEGRRSHSDHRHHLAARRQGPDLGVQSRRHLRRRARASTRRSSSSATTISTRTGAAARDWSGWYIVKIADPSQSRRLRRDVRRDVRQLVRRNQDHDREGVRRGLRQADRRHRRDHDRDSRRRAVHDSAGGGQHDGAVGARTHQRAGGAEDAGLLRTPRFSTLVLVESLFIAMLGGGLGLGAGHGCSFSMAIRPAACCRSSSCPRATW